MQAAVYHGQKDIRIEDITEGELGPNDVRVDIQASGICGSDIHEYVEGPIFIPTDRPHPLTGDVAPIPLGHEFGGTISEVGSNVEEREVGEPVAINPILCCGECQYCNRGKYNICESLGFIGLSGGSGGFAESAVIPAQNAIPFPAQLPIEYSALVEPYSVAVHAIHQSGTQLGDTVAVYGGGPIGLAVIEAAYAAGARKIIVSEPQDQRRQLAKELGADLAVDPLEESILDVINSETENGVDVSFEVAGIESALNQAIEGTKRGGHITTVSVFEKPAESHPNEISQMERSMNGTRAYNAGPLSEFDYEIAIDKIERGDFHPEKLITDRIALEDIVSEGFERLLDNKSQVKILIE